MTTGETEPVRGEATKQQKPWYLQWWVLVIAAGLPLVIAVQFIDFPERKPVSVPDLVGTNLSEARTELRDLDLEREEYDTEEDRTVLRSSNWEVVEQDPSEGTEVDADSVVTLGIRHQDDVHDEGAEAQEEEEDTTGEEAAEGAPEALAYTITLEEAFGDNGEVRIEFDLPDHFTAGLMARSAQRTAAEGLADAREEYPNADRYYVWINGQEGPASNAAFQPETLDALDLEDPTLNVFEHLDAGSAHPELLD